MHHSKVRSHRNGTNSYGAPSLGACLIAVITLGFLSACGSTTWPSEHNGTQRSWQGRRVREAAGQYFLVEEHANASTVLDSIRRTSEAFRRLVGQEPPLGAILVIDSEERFPLPSAYEWYSTATKTKAKTLRNPMPSDDSIRQQWLGEIAPKSPHEDVDETDLIQIISSQRYWVVKLPFPLLAPFPNELLELPPNLKDDIQWGLLVASDGLSNKVADELITTGFDVHDASAMERVTARLFRGRLRSSVLRETRLMIQAELFGTWLGLVEIETAVGIEHLSAFINELMQD